MPDRVFVTHSGTDEEYREKLIDLGYRLRPKDVSVVWDLNLLTYRVIERWRFGDND